MIFNGPVSLSTAARTLLNKGIMPTSLDTAGLRQLDASLRVQSLFSAQTTNEYLLQKYQDLLGTLLAPTVAPRPDTGELRSAGMTSAYARQEIKGFLAGIGYQAEPGEEGTIKDLSSDERINLVLDTNRQMSEGQGWWLQGQDETILDAYPAQELFRAEARVNVRNWIQRFTLAGQASGSPMGEGWTITDLPGQGPKMIALKNHPIWQYLGSSKLFDDALDQPWPPFAFRSGMDVRDVSRRSAQALGLITAAQHVPPMGLDDLKEAA